MQAAPAASCYEIYIARWLARRDQTPPVHRGRRRDSSSRTGYAARPPSLSKKKREPAHEREHHHEQQERLRGPLALHETCHRASFSARIATLTFRRNHPPRTLSLLLPPPSVAVSVAVAVSVIAADPVSSSHLPLSRAFPIFSLSRPQRKKKLRISPRSHHPRPRIVILSLPQSSLSSLHPSISKRPPGKPLPLRNEHARPTRPQRRPPSCPFHHHSLQSQESPTSKSKKNPSVLPAPRKEKALHHPSPPSAVSPSPISPRRPLLAIRTGRNRSTFHPLRY